MKRVGVKVVVGSGAAVAALAIAALSMAQQPAAPGPLQEPQWAYAIPTPRPAGAPAPAAAPPPAADVKHSLPGASRTFTLNEIRGVTPPGATPTGPADWYPEDHPPMPPVVAVGDAARRVTACALCHYPNGKGRPENSGVAGLTKEYLVQQLQDMKAGNRNSAEPRKGNATAMVNIAKGMTDEEIEAAAAYYASIKWTPWIRVVESDTAPKTRNVGGLLLPLTGPEAGEEPLDGRIVEVPENPERTELLRDPRSGFIAYAPKGSIEEGAFLADVGSCAICHGDGLVGRNIAPALAGRSPSYIARQLNDFKQGTRKGANAGQMTGVVRELTPADMTALAAYVGSLPPAP